MWQVGSVLGRFRLVKEIGQGSHGVVFIAMDTTLETQVAVKILHPWLTQDTAVRDRFKRELLLARRISHPGVCRLFDLHEEGGAFFITMELVEGETLLNILKKEGRLMPERAVRVMRGVCQALAAAHGAGVIHRDLKPANIIVRAGDTPMILDFGTATAHDVARVTRPGTAVGSMRFIAPEVFTGVSPSIRTDLYSLGVVAYVTLAGKLPYNQAAGAIEMLDMIRTQPPTRLDIAQADIPALLADVVGRAMEKDPDARFASALAFDEALAGVESQLAPAPGNKPKDFARWAPSAVIKKSVLESGAHPPVKLDEEEAVTTPDQRQFEAQNTDENPRPISLPPTEPLLEPVPVVVAEVVGDAHDELRKATVVSPAPRDLTVRLVEMDDAPPTIPSVRPARPPLFLIAGAAVGVLGIAAVVGLVASGGSDVVVADAGVRRADGAFTDAGEVDGHEALTFTEHDFEEPKPDKLPHARSHVEEGIHQVRLTMLKKGFIPGDLPGAEQSLAKAKKDKNEKLVQTAKATVEDQNVDRAFVMQKLSRFNKAFDRSRRPDIADRVEPLAREAAASFAAGQYEQANQKLNRAFALVGKSK